MGQFLREEIAAGHSYLPAGDNILRAFAEPMANVKVLITGQDPYPTPGHPVGLSFSVAPDVRPLPRSLTNIFTELHADLGIPPSPSGDLSPWAEQGVLLLNRVLTVRPGATASHRGKGWEAVTEQAIRALVAREQAAGRDPVGPRRPGPRADARRHPDDRVGPSQPAVGIARVLRLEAVQPRQRAAGRSGRRTRAMVAHADRVNGVTEEKRVRDRGVVIDEGLGVMQKWGLRIVVIAAAGLVLGWIIGHTWVVIFPVAMALIVTTILGPPAAWLRSKGWPSPLAAAAVMLSFIGAIVGIIAILTPQVAGQASEVAASASDGLQKVRDWLTGEPLNLSDGQITRAIEALQDKVQSSATSIGSGIFSTIGAATSAIVNLILVLMLTFFFVKDGHKFLPWLKVVAGQRAGGHIVEVADRAWATLGGFIRVQSLVALIDAVIIGAGLAILGSPLAIPLAVVTFFAAFIPIIGAFVSGALAVLVTLVTNDPKDALIALDHRRRRPAARGQRPLADAAGQDHEPPPGRRPARRRRGWHAVRHHRRLPRRTRRRHHGRDPALPQRAHRRLGRVERPGARRRGRRDPRQGLALDSLTG